MNRKPIRRKSAKTAARDRRYARERLAFLGDHPLCEVSWDEGCTAAATDCHHRRGRGKYALDRSTFIAACRHCHGRIHAEPAEAYLRGFLEHRNQSGEAA